MTDEASEQALLVGSAQYPRARRQIPDAVWSIVGVLVSLVFLAPLLALAHADIGRGYHDLADASFGSSFSFGFLLLAATPLVLVGVGVAVPFRAGLFNLGGEGQLLLGALIAVEVAVAFPVSGNSPVSFVVPLAAGAGAGALVAIIPASLKARRGASEIVTTIMLNFIVTFLVQYLVRGPFEGANAVYPTTDLVPAGIRLGRYGPSSLIPMGYVVAVFVALVVWAVMEFTRLGWRQRLVGLNRLVAARQGISVPREWMVALAIGGAVAGLGGACEALGNQLQVGYSFSPGWGWDSISIALLARGNALAVVPFALYFAFLRNGALVLQQDLQVSSDLILAMGGAPVMLVASIIGYRSYRRFTAEPVPD